MIKTGVLPEDCKLLTTSAKLHKTIFPERTAMFQQAKCSNEACEDTHVPGFIPLNDDIRYVLKKASKMLEKNGFKIDDKCFHLDFHCYNLEDKTCQSQLMWHKDDYGATNYPVNTMIIYLRKDPTIIGGNLLFEEMKHIKEIKVSSNMIIMMHGQVTHKPQEMSGIGCRDSIVIQFKRPQ